MTLTPTPVAPFATATAMLGRMLAACTILRTRCGLDAADPDAEDKLLGEGSNIRRIFYPRVEIDERSLFPLVVIVPGGRRFASFALESMTHDRGILAIEVADTVTSYTENVEQAARDFDNFWGVLLYQLAAQSGADFDDYPDEPYTKLRFSAIEEIDAPFKSPPEEVQQRWQASAACYYGHWPELELHRGAM